MDFNGKIISSPGSHPLERSRWVELCRRHPYLRLIPAVSERESSDSALVVDSLGDVGSMHWVHGDSSHIEVVGKHRSIVPVAKAIALSLSGDFVLAKDDPLPSTAEKTSSRPTKHVAVPPEYSPKNHEDLFVRFCVAEMLVLLVPLSLLIVLSVVVNPGMWKDASASTYGIPVGSGLIIAATCFAMWRYNYIHLTRDGVLVNYPLGRLYYHWNEVSNFRVVPGPSDGIVQTGERIIFDLTTDSPRKSWILKLLTSFASFQESDMLFMTAFEIEPEMLAAVLNEWQNFHGQVPRRPTSGTSLG